MATFDLEVMVTGICAFVPDIKGKRHCVVLPDCTAIDNGKSTIDKRTRLGTHFGLVHLAARHAAPSLADLDAEYVWHLRRQRLTLELSADDRAANPPVTSGLDGVLAIEKTINDPSPDPAIVGAVPPRSVLAHYVIDAGRVEPDMISQRVWKASPTVKSPEYKQKFAHGVAVRLSRISGATLVATPLDPAGAVQRLPLHPGRPGEKVRLYVTNICYDNPLEWERGEEAPRPDVDVAWYYELLSAGAKKRLETDLANLPVPDPERTVPILQVHSLGAGGSNCTPAFFPPLELGF